MVGSIRGRVKMNNRYDDYIGAENVQIGSVVKVLNGYYKITHFEGSSDKLSLFCKQSRKVNNYIDLNHDFIKVNTSVYEFDNFIPTSAEEFEIRYKLFLRMKPSIPQSYLGK